MLQHLNRYSAFEWAKQGWYVEILLPMCADYQMPGVTDTEDIYGNICKLYKEIKAEGLSEYIDITTKDRKSMGKPLGKYI